MFDPYDLPYDLPLLIFLGLTAKPPPGGRTRSGGSDESLQMCP